MKKTKITTIVLITLVAALALTSIRPAQAYITNYVWTPPYAYYGYDSYYDEYIVAYLNGSTVKVKVLVDSSYYSYVNLTSVGIYFDWGTNANKTLITTAQVKLNQIVSFDVTFTANINEAPNTWAHTYTVYVKYENPYHVNDTMTYSYSYRYVVYTQDQKDYNDLWDTYDGYHNSMPPYYFNTIQGRMLATQAVAEAYTSSSLHDRGDFAGAKTHINNSVSLYKQALDYEGTHGTEMQDAEMNATLTEANAAETEADAAMLTAQGVSNQAYGYILFGLGWVLIGLGVIIFGMRKPKPPT